MNKATLLFFLILFTFAACKKKEVQPPNQSTLIADSVDYFTSKLSGNTEQLFFAIRDLIIETDSLTGALLPTSGNTLYTNDSIKQFTISKLNRTSISINYSFYTKPDSIYYLIDSNFSNEYLIFQSGYSLPFVTFPPRPTLDSTLIHSLVGIEGWMTWPGIINYYYKKDSFVYFTCGGNTILWPPNGSSTHRGAGSSICRIKD